MWDRAACARMDTDTFFRDPNEPVNDEVKAICRGCEIREPCLEYAVRLQIDAGIWGGLTARERASLRHRRAADQARRGPASRRAPGSRQPARAVR